MSHSDSAADAPGAADDGFGVAVTLEAARVLGARTDRRHTLMVLVTDGEEDGLMGAAGLTADREVMDRLQAYVNVEAIGSSGNAMLFETGPGNGWIVRPWAQRGAASARRIVRDRDLPPPAERHGLLDPQASRHPRAELRAHRRQLRVSHGTRHGGPAVAAHAPGDRRERRRDDRAARPDWISVSDRPPTRRSSTSARRWRSHGDR